MGLKRRMARQRIRATATRLSAKDLPPYEAVLHALALVVKDVAEIKDVLRRHKLVEPARTESGLYVPER